MVEDTPEKHIYPRVTIVMAVYKPREDWLTEQLASLNNQTYGNLDLIVCDDCPEAPVSEDFISRHITNFPYKIVFNDKNLGSNRTFERLTMMAEGDYIAYCDQDDIWEVNKIEMLVRRLERQNAVLCCSDVSIIDKNGHQTADSITKIRKRHVFKEGYNLAPDLIVHNFVTGCAMIVKTEIAKKAVPFEEHMVHDHWLALFSALQGYIAFEPTPTVKYRQHDNNQTGVLSGVHTKDDYYKLRIEHLYNRVASLRRRLAMYPDFIQVLDSVQVWVMARKEFFYKHNLKNIKRMLRYRSFSNAATVFEIFMPLIPDFFFDEVIKLLR